MDSLQHLQAASRADGRPGNTSVLGYAQQLYAAISKVLVQVERISWSLRSLNGPGESGILCVSGL